GAHSGPPLPARLRRSASCGRPKRRFPEHGLRPPPRRGPHRHLRRIPPSAAPRRAPADPGNRKAHPPLRPRLGPLLPPPPDPLARLRPLPRSAHDDGVLLGHDRRLRSARSDPPSPPRRRLRRSPPRGAMGVSHGIPGPALGLKQRPGTRRRASAAITLTTPSPLFLGPSASRRHYRRKGRERRAQGNPRDDSGPKARLMTAQGNALGDRVPA